MGEFTNRRNGDVVSFCLTGNSDTGTITSVVDSSAMQFLEYDRTTWRHTVTDMKGITAATSLEVHKIVNWPAGLTDAIKTPCIAWKVPCEQLAPNACTSTVSGATYYGGFTYTKATGTNK